MATPRLSLLLAVEALFEKSVRSGARGSGLVRVGTESADADRLSDERRWLLRATARAHQVVAG